MPTYIFLYAEIIALIIGLIQYKKLGHTPYKYFIPFLLFTIIFEMGSLMKWFSINHTNLWALNIMVTITFLFYSIFLLNALKTQAFKKWIKRAIVLSIFLSALNMAFFQGFMKLDTVTILIEYVIIITLNFLFFYELMNNSDKHLNVLRLPGFWLNTGLMFFCLSEFLYFSSFAYMAYKNSYEYFFLVMVVSNAANLILYSCLSASFLCFNKIMN